MISLQWSDCRFNVMSDETFAGTMLRDTHNVWYFSDAGGEKVSYNDAMQIQAITRAINGR